MPEKPKIGIDIDDVVVEFVKGYLDFYNRRFGTDFSTESVSTYNLWETLKISKQQSADLIYEFYDSREFENLEIVEGAKGGIEELAKKHDNCFVTARPVVTREKTERYFGRRLPGNGYKLFFSGDFFGGGRSKSEILRELEIPLMIEDNADYALDCANSGIRVLLLDKPWNKGYAPHENIVKVKNWAQILENANC